MDVRVGERPGEQARGSVSPAAAGDAVGQAPADALTAELGATARRVSSAGGTLPVVESEAVEATRGAVRAASIPGRPAGQPDDLAGDLGQQQLGGGRQWAGQLGGQRGKEGVDRGLVAAMRGANRGLAPAGRAQSRGAACAGLDARRAPSWPSIRAVAPQTRSPSTG